MFLNAFNYFIVYVFNSIVSHLDSALGERWDINQISKQTKNKLYTQNRHGAYNFLYFTYGLAANNRRPHMRHENPKPWQASIILCILE